LASAAAFVPLARSIEISAAKSSLLLFLTDARRRAYGSDSRIDLVREKDLIRMNSGDRLVRTFRLPAQISISRWPRRKTLRFYPSGLADNATVGLSAHGAKATVVVNHRGMVR
jgi:hypothetical protein